MLHVGIESQATLLLLTSEHEIFFKKFLDYFKIAARDVSRLWPCLVVLCPGLKSDWVPGDDWFPSDLFYDKVLAEFYRPRLGAYIDDYVSRCSNCMVNKVSRQKIPRNLLLIDIEKQSQEAFKCVRIDFIVGLPFSRRFNAIMVVVDKFTHFGTFIPMNSNYIAILMADLFVKHVLCADGWLPSKFITDHDAKFLADF